MRANADAATEKATAASAASLGLIDVGEGGGGGRAKNEESVNVGGVQLVSPTAVDRAAAPAKNTAGKVEIDDVVLADDYQ